MENWRVELDKILQGIDEEETHDEYGWWETSIGAEFGRATKDVLVEFIEKELDKAREDGRKEGYEEGAKEAANDIASRI